MNSSICRLDGNLIVKVSDFGLARSVDETSHHEIQDKCKDLPIRWMGIESIKEGIFTMHSDVVRINAACNPNLLRKITT